jgi:hypothetical protein
MNKILLCFVFATSSLLASNIVNVKLTGTGSPTVTAVVPGDGISSAVYIGPYQVSLNGGASVDALCIDPLHENSVGNTWTAYQSTPGGDISNTYHPSGTSNVLGYNVPTSSIYELDAAIFYLFENGYVTNSTDRTNLQIAAWSFFDPSIAAANTGALNAALSFGETAYAAGDFANFNLLDFTILTDTNNRHQEFMVNTADVPTPEPLSLGLMGAGLLGLSAFKLRRRSKRS